MFALREEKPWVWYLKLHGFAGDEDEFVGGEYIVRMKAPEGFPFKPPHFRFMTPNGVYDVEKKVCINIGQFHSDQYRAALGMSGFANQLVSGMIGWKTLGGGISLLNTTLEKKKELASYSIEYNNTRHKEILNKIDDAYNTYSAKSVTV